MILMNSVSFHSESDPSNSITRSLFSLSWIMMFSRPQIHNERKKNENTATSFNSIQNGWVWRFARAYFLYINIERTSHFISFHFILNAWRMSVWEITSIYIFSFLKQIYRTNKIRGQVEWDDREVTDDGWPKSKAKK